MGTVRGIKHRVSNIKREYLESLQVDVDRGSLLIQVPTRTTCNVDIYTWKVRTAHCTPLLIALGTEKCVTMSVAVHRGHRYPRLQGLGTWALFMS